MTSRTGTGPSAEGRTGPGHTRSSACWPTMREAIIRLVGELVRERPRPGRPGWLVASAVWGRLRQPEAERRRRDAEAGHQER